MPQDHGAPAQGERFDRPLAERSEIGSFIVMDVMRAAAAAEAAGQSVVHMEVGQPGTAAPAAARAAAAQAVEADRLGYTLALGLPELRARIARHYAERYSVDIDPARVVITSGSSAGFVLAFTALFDRGDRLALPSPGYPCYRQISTALNIEPVIIETGAADRWMPTRAAIEAMAARGNGLDGLLVASPANPTGTMLTPERLADLIAVCREQNAWFISDEIYHGLTYGEPEATALAYSDDVIVINSFSKYFSMTGWRVGWMVVPERTVATFEKLTQNMYIAAPTISQVAALAAFEATEELEANRARYAQNREVLMAGLAGVGLDQIVPADGAFYLYVDVGHLTDDSLRFARRMLDETGIAVTPGLDFDAERGGRFIRFSYAGTPEDMTACIDRLRAWDVLRGG